MKRTSKQTTTNLRKATAMQKDVKRKNAYRTTKLKQQTSIRLANGNIATLKLEELLHGEFRITLYKDVRIPIVESYFVNGIEALIFFEYLCHKYHIPHISKSSVQLAQDLTAAVSYSKTFMAGHDDNNSNQDSLYLILDGWNRAEIMNAAKLANIYCFKACHTEDVYFFLPYDIGQGAARTRFIESMCEYLEACGYKARVSYTLG